MSAPAPAPGPAPVQPLVRILGTGHVFPLRAAVQDEVFAFRPAVVALELDPARLQGLLTPPEARVPGKGQGVGYGIMARFQQRIAKDMGGDVGDEMLAAREAAMLTGSLVALVDRPVDQTYRRLLREITWKERIKLVGSAIMALVPGPWLKGDIDRVLSGDPTLVEEVARSYPTVIRVLLDERNEHMATQLRHIATVHGRVLAVVGDAHVPGMEKMLKDAGVPVESVRLAELSRRTKGGSTHRWSVGA